MKPYHMREVQEIARDLRTDPVRGLPRADIPQRLAAYGPNQFARAAQRNIWRILGQQISNPMNLLLLAAVGTSLSIGHLLDAIIVSTIVLINASIGFIQGFRAERAMASIRQLATPTATVVRDGVVQAIAATHIVPGDVVQLEAGNRIPADLRLLEATHLQVDESLLTGESASALKTVETLQDATLPLGDQSNMGFSGTHVLTGRARGLAVATGAQSALGTIAATLTTTPHRTDPLTHRTRRLAHQLVLVAIGLCGVVFTLGLAWGTPLPEMLLASISLGIAAIPEGLPAVITISLALGSLRLAQRGVLVRSINAIETLGAITVACADKTGTLTANRMIVRYPAHVDDPQLPPMLFTALALCNDAHLGDGTQAGRGDPMELALLAFAKHHHSDLPTLHREWPRIHEFPFDPTRKRMSTIHQHGSQRYLFMKGAPEHVLALCTQHLTAAQQTVLLQQHAELAQQGLRLLAVAMRVLPAEANHDDPSRVEHALQFLGFIGLFDPPRPDAAHAIAECRSAGIHPIMITGDHRDTAFAIAHEIGLATETSAVITGQELHDASRDWLSEHLAHVNVFARINPDDKLVIVQQLQARGDCVLMTGDGVNDGPALKGADVGIAMGRGADIAKESAALILLEEDFSTIVHGIREGRLIYNNMRKFIRYILTTNFGEISAMLIATAMGWPILLLPVHLLWINLVTDGFPAIALSYEPDEGDVMRQPPHPPHEGLLARGMWQHMLWVGLLMGALTIGTVLFAQQYHLDATALHTIAFTTLTFAQMGHLLGVRSETRPLWRLGLCSNWRLLVALLGTIAAQLALMYFPPLQPIFHTTALPWALLVLCVVPAAIIYGAVEIEKWWHAHRHFTRV